MSAYIFDASTVTPAPGLRCTFHPAPGSPWRQIPDDEAPAPASTSTLTLTKFTATNPSRLSKAFSLKAGKLIKQAGGNLIDGRADRIETDLAGMAELLATLGPQHAIGYGVTQADSARVVTRDQYDRMAAHCETEDSDIVARTREHFDWPATPGVMMVDYDPPTTGEPLTREQLLEALAQACPALATAAAIWRPSASSCIYTAAGQQLRGIAGQRVYLPVQDARDIPRAGQAISDRLWLAGHGRIDLSGSGAMLERTIIDSAVYQPERLDFAGGAECGPGLEQRLPAPLLINQDAGYLDSRIALPDLTGPERAQLATMKEAARSALKPQADAARESWIGERVDHAVKRLPKEQREEAKSRIERAYREAADGGSLGPDVIIHIQGMGERSIGQVLAKPTQYHGKLCRDPLEPGYQNNKLVGWLNLRAASPYIRSQAHGGMRYSLIAQQQEPAAPLAKKKNINRDLNILASVRPTQATATAVAIAQRYAGDSPRHRTLDGLATSIRHAMTGQTPSVISTAMTAVDRQLAGYQRHALAQATSAIRLSFGTPAADMRELVSKAMNAPRGSILLVKAPQGAGKTQELLKPVAAALGGNTTVIAVSAKVSLVADLASRLQLTDYKIARTGELEGSTGIAICENSLNNPKFSEILHRPDTVLLIDEIDRVLAEVHNPRGTMGKKGKEIFDALTRLIQNARLIIGVDADLNNQTVQTVSAMRRPDQNLVIHTVESRWALPTIRFGEDKQIWSEICSSVQNNEKVLVTADSAGTVIRLTKLLRAIHPKKRIVEIQSRHGVATTGDPAIVKLLQDINSGIANIDVLICSPAVESGISITTPHFTRHFSLYQGVIAPSQIVQQLRRDRTATTITLGLAGSLKRNDPTDAGAILANLDAAHRKTVTASVAAGDGFTVTQHPATDYDRRVCAYQSQEATAKNHAGRNLLLMLEALGYHTERLDCTAPEIATADLAMARDLELAAGDLAIQIAPDITETEREQIKQDYQPTPAESAAACRYDIRQTTGKVDEFEEIEERDLRAWRDGKLVSECSRFDALMNDPDAPAIDAQDEQNNVPISLRSHRQSLVEASRALFTAAQLDPDTGAGTVTNASALAAWKALANTPTAQVLERHRICRFERKPPAYPVRWLNQTLNKFGLDLGNGAQIVRAHMPGKEEVFRPHVCVAASPSPVHMPGKEEVFRPHVDQPAPQERERTYTIKRDPSMDKAGVRVTHPGWDAMRGYHEARLALPRREFSRPATVDIDIGAVVRNAQSRQAGVPA